MSVKASQPLLLAPYYRKFDLPWEVRPEERERFNKLLWIGFGVLAFFTVLFVFVPTPKRERNETAVPERLARVMIEQQAKPKPPPPPKVEEKPKPIAKPVPVPVPIDRAEAARKKAQHSGLLKFQDELADLREDIPVDSAPTRNLTGVVGADSHAERSLITSKVGIGSGGITSADVSRGYGSGAGSLTGVQATRVSSAILRSSGAESTRTGESGKAARSREEIELVFDRNKGAIYALYSRELREHPELQGKLVLEFTIAPSGEVTMCRVISSELGDPDLERKIVTRVRLFHFEPKDVAPITTTKPIEFFPA